MNTLCFIRTVATIGMVFVYAHLNARSSGVNDDTPPSKNTVVITMTQSGQIIVGGKVTPLVQVMNYFDSLPKNTAGANTQILLDPQHTKGPGVSWTFEALRRAGLRKAQFSPSSLAPEVAPDLLHFTSKRQLTYIDIATCDDVGRRTPLLALESFLWAVHTHNSSALAQVLDFSKLEPNGPHRDESVPPSDNERSALVDGILKNFGVVRAQYYDAKKVGERASVWMLFDTGANGTRFIEFRLRHVDAANWRVTNYGQFVSEAI